MKCVVMCKLLSALFLSLSCSVLGARNFAVSTNLLGYADFCTVNLEASYGLARHWSLCAGFKYNPFPFGSGENTMWHRQRSFSAGARYWPWHVYSGWWMSAAIRYQEYNDGSMSSEKISEGDRFGAVVGGGYTYMLSPSINLDFGLGLWSGYDGYSDYDCRTCGKLIGRGRRFFVLPADIIIGLTYIF